MFTDKPVLAIETSGSLCGAALYFSDRVYFEVNVEYKNIHAEKIFEAVDFVMKSAGVRSSDLAMVAVSAGPGSFTGLRIGMSAAKGIAFGAGIPVLAVPTFEALALQLSSYLPEETEFVIATKVNMDEVYFAKFQIKFNNYIFAEDLKIIHKSELADKSNGSLIFGNAAETCSITAPAPHFIAAYASLNKDKLTFNYDYLEPDYIKNFIIPAHVNVSNNEKGAEK